MNLDLPPVYWFGTVNMGGYNTIIQNATPEAQSLFVVRYQDEDLGWVNLQVRAANEDEARGLVDGPVAAVYAAESRVRN